MKKFFLVILTLLFLTFENAECHKFYLTLCNIEQKNNSLEIELKFFMHDLEICMINESYPALLFGTGHENPKSGKYLEEHISKHFIVDINGSRRKIKFERYKASPNCYEEPCNPDLLAVWCYLKVENVNMIASLEIYSDLIVSEYPDHKMVCKINTERGKKQFIIDEANKREKVTF